MASLWLSKSEHTSPGKPKTWTALSHPLPNFLYLFYLHKNLALISGTHGIKAEDEKIQQDIRNGHWKISRKPSRFRSWGWGGGKIRQVQL